MEIKTRTMIKTFIFRVINVLLTQTQHSLRVLINAKGQSTIKLRKSMIY